MASQSPTSTPTPDAGMPRVGVRRQASKRPLSRSEEGSPASQRRKPVKVSRACDLCKSRKSKCDGMIPCGKCVTKGHLCQYDAKYSRGRPPTPPPSTIFQATSGEVVVVAHPRGVASGAALSINTTAPAGTLSNRTKHGDDKPASKPAISHRPSPGLGMEEIQGQAFDLTSGVTFLHRAWKRLSRQHGRDTGGETPAIASLNQRHFYQPWMLAGDKPMQCCASELDKLLLPAPSVTCELLSLYFDVCIATYRFLHRGTTESWLHALECNVQMGKPVWTDIGKSRAAIVLTLLALAATHLEKSRQPAWQPSGLTDPKLHADEWFFLASNLISTETGIPRLELAQAHLIQVLYLLTTSRMNRAWYTFGNLLQITAALGLHRRGRKGRIDAGNNSDYIWSQCAIRTFWAAYILDQHLSVVFGRPRHYHDEDIDQEYPASVNDEAITAQGPVQLGDGFGNEGADCLIDALVFHARIAQIIGQISKEVYSIKPVSDRDRVAASHRLCEKLHEWHNSLPAHLGSIRPSSLIPSLRRQATVLRLVYSHAIIHANRLFLLGDLSGGSEHQISECLSAAKVVFEIVDGLARDGPIFHSFWWTHYITFCALLVTYVWEIQHRRNKATRDVKVDHGRLLELASRCHRHLANATATNSPSRRYAVILEEFHREATGMVSREASPQPAQANVVPVVEQSSWVETRIQGPAKDTGAYMTRRGNSHDQNPPHPIPKPQYIIPEGFIGAGQAFYQGPNLLDEWQTTDWLEFDASAFGPFLDFESPVSQYMPSAGPPNATPRFDC